MNEKHWGALPDDWDHFDLILGLSQDLLPVVSNPNAKVSARSTVKTLGKVPSLYNKQGEAVGISDWTSKSATAAELERWSVVADYGICLQTRAVRALDIDVEDEVLAQKIEDIIFGTLGFRLPVRRRADSAKRLFIYRAGYGCAENKKVLPVKDGIIEYLAVGQQFIAVGTHVCGVAYQWAGGLPMAIPVLTGEVEAIVWQNLVDSFGAGAVSESGNRKPKSVEVKRIDDDITDSLELLGLSTGKRGRDGTVYIGCPWKYEHTEKDIGNRAGTSTAYFPAGGRGYEQGHFKCLHAHCAGRSDREFRTALGLEPVCDFEDLGPLEEVSAPVIAIPLDYELRTNDDGKILATVENLSAILSKPELCGHHVCYDTFRAEIVYKKVGDKEWKPFKDTDYTKLRINLALTGFLPITHDTMRHVVRYVSEIKKIDTAIEWLTNIEPWDGTPRVSRFLKDYMAAEDSPYSTAVSEYMWTALAGRVLDPGCKADGAPIFVGEQYIGKSYAVACMVPEQRLYVEIKLDDEEDNLARKIRGKLIAEFAELKGLHNKDTESVKAYISRQHEEWVPKYDEFSTTFPRRLLFIGTSNKEEFLADETGDRRWFPIRVYEGDYIAIKRDRDQLWAEAKIMFEKEHSVQPFYEKANTLAKLIREQFTISDVWDESVFKYLHMKDENGIRPVDREFLFMHEIMHEVFGVGQINIKRFDTMRVGKILHKNGFKTCMKRVDGVPKRVWMKVAML